MIELTNSKARLCTHVESFKNQMANYVFNEANLIIIIGSIY